MPCNRATPAIRRRPATTRRSALSLFMPRFSHSHFVETPQKSWAGREQRGGDGEEMGRTGQFSSETLEDRSEGGLTSLICQLVSPLPLPTSPGAPHFTGTNVSIFLRVI
jgi:hypothetical protein